MDKIVRLLGREPSQKNERREKKDGACRPNVQLRHEYVRSHAECGVLVHHCVILVRVRIVDFLSKEPRSCVLALHTVA